MFAIRDRGSSIRTEVIGGVFVSGVIFLIITLIGVRTWLAESLSTSMKNSFAAGIGLFLTFIGLTETGIVKASQAVPVQLGDVRSATVLLSIFGFVLIAALLYRRVPGAILIGIVVTAIAGALLGTAKLPTAVVAMPYSLAPIAFELEVAALFRLAF